ncbi:hypothetical protein [Prauserella cavernicola]|uniref:Uncharacterized protein n=1 Tax=Prauserella cavernicola TaxID=2800127 RepID=A0A934QRQ5_9PSEU|nr:hypothetical protein [Prauserella cavernicola]MBK1784981.1 hypothetical protein [Prauserella cavernicola]
MTDDTVTETKPEQETPAEQPQDAPPPEPPAGWDPYSPPPARPAPAGWDPYSPPARVAPAGWDPYSPPQARPAPAGWDPYSPPPAPAGWDPYSPPPAATPAPTGWDPYSSPPSGAAQQQPNGHNGASAGGGWVNGRAVTHLFSTAGSPGVWVAVHGIGWKRLSPASESGHSHLTLLALLAKNYRLPVSYHEDERGQIDQLVV